MKEFKLDSVPKISTGFKVPENYLENFSIDVNDKRYINETKIVSFSKYKKPFLYIAAAVLIIGLIVPVFYNWNISKTKEIDEATLENYLCAQPTITQYEIIDLLESEDIHNLQTTVEKEDQDQNLILSNNND
jgi:hypothetical protein